MRSKGIRVHYQNALVNDYLYNFSAVREFFTYDPFSSESFKRRHAYLTKKTNQNRESVVETLRDYNAKLGAGKQTMENIEALRQEDAVVVVTGQQAGILGGPLYTVYKALTAIQLAKKASAELGVPVIPLFWIASEDHDFGEINHVQVADREGQPHKVTLSYEPGGKYSIGDIPVPEIDGFLDELAALIPETEFKAEELGFFRASAAESDNLANWFGKILLRWLGTFGLVLVNPAERNFRSLERALFTAAINNSAQVNTLLHTANSALMAKDYPVTVEKDPANVNLFMYWEKERLPLLLTGDGYTLRGSDKRFTKQELIALIEQKPELFSPKVELRPLSQDELFPTLAYVGGPGEISYFAEYQEIYRLFGLEMPVIFPRANLTVLDGGTEKYINKYRLGLEDLLQRPEEIRTEFLAAADEFGIEGIFSSLTDKVSAAYAETIDAVQKLNPSLEKLGLENRERVLSQVHWLKEKTLQAHRQANDTFLRQFRKLCNGLAPRQQFQERFYGAIQLVFKYGPALFTQLGEVPLIDTQDHKLIFLKD
ncbi:MAG TPA: bacillithiol biosynthesis cysteine-adding enzyme BshC [Desulfobacteria bacterium]|nr:bacillithiol biosynthesis cysteine-adding enzyme BshC [Desulfobacteria bacterium]